MKKKIVVGIVLVLSLSISIGIYVLNVTKEKVIFTGIDGKTITAFVGVDFNKMTNNLKSKSVKVGDIFDMEGTKEIIIGVSDDGRFLTMQYEDYITEQDNKEKNKKSATIENSQPEILDNNVENQLSSQNYSSEIDTSGQNFKETLSLEDDQIIKDFSYVVNMNKWGNVLFCPCLPSEKKQDISCYLVNDDETIACIFPSVDADNILDSDLAEFLEIDDVAFVDINGDEMTDVVMIISYMNVNQSVRRRIRIYLNGEEGFCLDTSIMDQYNYEDNTDSIDINKLINN